VRTGLNGISAVSGADLNPDALIKRFNAAQFVIDGLKGRC
jgi:hypothetical protein